MKLQQISTFSDVAQLILFFRQSPNQTRFWNHLNNQQSYFPGPFQETHRGDGQAGSTKQEVGAEVGGRIEGLRDWGIQGFRSRHRIRPWVRPFRRLTEGTIKSSMKRMKPGNRWTITQTITDNEIDSPQSYPVIVAVIVHRKGKKPGENDHFAASCWYEVD